MLSPIRGAYVAYDTNFFRNAAFSKLLTLLVPISTTLCSVSRSGDREKHFLRLSELNVGTPSKILDVLSKLFFFCDLQMIVPALSLIYCFRMIERHFGTTKFMYLFSSQVLISTAAYVCIARCIDYDSALPCGPIAVFIAMYFVFLSEIPLISYGSVFGVPLTIHFIPIVMIAQFLSMDNLLVSALIGLITATISVKFVNRFKQIPSIWMNVEWFKNILEPSMETVLPIAATIERQRIEAMDEIERQLMRSQMNQIYGPETAQSGRGTNYITNLLRQLNGGENRVEVSEVNIQQLMDMGFRDREAVRLALIQSENNTHEATNILLRNGQNQ